MGLNDQKGGGVIDELFVFVSPVEWSTPSWLERLTQQPPSSGIYSQPSFNSKDEYKELLLVCTGAGESSDGYPIVRCVFLLWNGTQIVTSLENECRIYYHIIYIILYFIY